MLRLSSVKIESETVKTNVVLRISEILLWNSFPCRIDLEEILAARARTTTAPPTRPYSRIFYVFA